MSETTKQTYVQPTLVEEASLTEITLVSGGGPGGAPPHRPRHG